MFYDCTAMIAHRHGIICGMDWALKTCSISVFSYKALNHLQSRNMYCSKCILRQSLKKHTSQQTLILRCH